MALRTVKFMTNTSPSTASTAAGTDTITGLDQYDWFDITAVLTGATGGTLDVYIQRKEADTWIDWIHFAQMTAGQAASRRHVPGNGTIATITTIGSGTSPALAAGAACGGHPGDQLRMLFVAGAGTSAGASQTVRVQCHKMGT